MVSSGCLVLEDEPQRFIDYILADPRMREKIVDERSFVAVLDKVLKSDSSLTNIPTEITKQGESLEICGKNIFNDQSIQSIVKRNKGKKRKEISKRVKIDHPTATRRQHIKETTRRLNIFITGTVNKVTQTKQVTINQALRPVKVKEYKRGGQSVEGYTKTKYKTLTQQEKMLMENAIRKGKKPSEVQQDYLQAGLGFRSPTSIKRHYYRLKGMIKP